jgi:hypothetical protein
MNNEPTIDTPRPLSGSLGTSQTESQSYPHDRPSFDDAVKCFDTICSNLTELNQECQKLTDMLPTLKELTVRLGRNYGGNTACLGSSVNDSAPETDTVTVLPAPTAETKSPSTGYRIWQSGK